ncbi:MAG TPA: VOC family protein, partial [Gemmataceae bacterium]|nr:VOC family protein [Gemmataceae bacterium]
MATVNPIPEGMHSLTPHLICRNAKAAIDFYKQALGARELNRSLMPGGKIIHATLQIGNSWMFLNDEFPEMGASAPPVGTPPAVTIHLQVPNVDEVFQRAVAAGAKVTMPAMDMFWGDRYGKFQDPFGHEWSVATHIKDVSPQEMEVAMKNMFSGDGMKSHAPPAVQAPKAEKAPKTA